MNTALVVARAPLPVLLMLAMVILAARRKIRLAMIIGVSAVVLYGAYMIADILGWP